MGGKAARRKGNDFERAVVNQFKAAGFKARRVPLSGAGYIPNDVHVYLNGRWYEIECKCRKRSPLYKLIEPADFVIIKADLKEPLITMRLNDFMELTTHKQE